MPDRIAPIAFLLAALAGFATHGCGKSRQDEHARQLADRVRTEFLHAWNNYEALDTLILMHLDAEAERARSLIISDLSFSLAIFTSKISR